MKKILVPIDGSEGSKLAIEEAKNLGKFYDAEITLFNVVSYVASNPYMLDTIRSGEVKDVFTKESREMLERTMAEFEDYDGKVDSEVVVGDPAKEIIKKAEDGHYDLIIIGNRGLGAFSRAMMGSVSGRVINHVNTSVLVVKGK